MSFTQLKKSSIVITYHKIKDQIDMDLTSRYRIAINEFFLTRGIDIDINNIRKVEIKKKLSIIDTFYQCILKYLGEKMLEEIYFGLFYDFIWEPNRISKKEFYEMDLKERCRFVYKNIPSHAKNNFQIYFHSFVIDVQSFEYFKKLNIIDNDSLSIVKSFLF